MPPPHSCRAAELTRFELIKGCASSAKVRGLLGLPAVIRKAEREQLNQLFSWLEVPSTLFEDAAPSARLGPPWAQAAPMHSAAQPQQLGSSGFNSSRQQALKMRLLRVSTPRLFEQLDTNKSGRVTLAEFRRVFAAAVGGWLEQTDEAVIAEPLDAADAEEFRKLKLAQARRTAPSHDPPPFKPLHAALTLVRGACLGRCSAGRSCARPTTAPTSRARGRAAASRSERAPRPSPTWLPPPPCP